MLPRLPWLAEEREYSFEDDGVPGHVAAGGIAKLRH